MSELVSRPGSAPTPPSSARAFDLRARARAQQPTAREQRRLARQLDVLVAEMWAASRPAAATAVPPQHASAG